VQPFILIGKRLLEMGHRVRLATHACYRDFVTSNQLEFYPLSGDPQKLSEYMVKSQGCVVPLSSELLYEVFTMRNR
jgi:UDP:flavonoid glycosyltransferase YjiC (YdhE family)